MKKILVLLAFVMAVQLNLQAQKNLKVWIVRHAEKDTTDQKDSDPELSSAGAKRAEYLAKMLKGKGIDSIFATDYKRTKLTGFPLADIIGINVKTYNPKNALAFANGLKENALGKKILLIGHSNTILELIEAFGGKRPVNNIPETEYDNLFQLTVTGNKVEVSAKKYGDK